MFYGDEDLHESDRKADSSAHKSGKETHICTNKKSDHSSKNV